MRSWPTPSAAPEDGWRLRACGRRVLALCAPDSIDFFVTCYAASSIGAVIATLNPLSPGQEIFLQLCQSGARWLVTTGELFVPKLEVAARPSAVRVAFLIGAGAGTAPSARRFDVLDPGGYGHRA